MLVPGLRATVAEISQAVHYVSNDPKARSVVPMRPQAPLLSRFPVAVIALVDADSLAARITTATVLVHVGRAVLTRLARFYFTALALTQIVALPLSLPLAADIASAPARIGALRAAHLLSARYVFPALLLR